MKSIKTRIPKFLGYAPVTGTGWSIAVTLPKSEVFADLKRLTATITIITLLLILLSIGTAFILACRISRPLRLSAEHLEVVASGDFTKEVSPIYLNMKDEIGMLAKSINKMQTSFTLLIKCVADASTKMVNLISHADDNMP
ncbi:HAMP domain-containing protein [Geosporobacter ferrireducens]|uniref:histidine kinase n=1 Tax=Geosporobacter ferrireducens TaxID=1424294 RepID=A0A1D8GM67_9FIRM|nr:HAMP domain-containing protein [Geosporobacter ferrireducens]AOT71882.1 hypothetical protein Gferi_21505 [Geosporobacter ferrireducens]MTI55670.1 HAMP domain-containing protein [Geosporobacter ferrireducens]